MYEIKKAAKGYIVIITHEDGTVNDYRFTSKRELNAWMKKAGLN